MRNLPLYDGWPVPWFASWEDHKPNLAAGMSDEKFSRALVHRVCIVCGHSIKAPLAFVDGVRLGIEQAALVPASHIDCAQWVAARVEHLPRPPSSDGGPPGGFGLVRLLWICRGWELRHTNGQARFTLWAPETVEWYMHGRSARRFEVLDSLEASRRELERLALTWSGGLAELRRRRARLERWLPNN
jgi:hypothetical protein